MFLTAESRGNGITIHDGGGQLFNQFMPWYHSHFKRLISTAGEMIERYNNNISEMDDETLLVDLTEQLERKRTILLDLDRQISAGL